MPADAPPNELATYNYFIWEEAQRLKQYRATLEERKRQASISSARRRQLFISSTGATEGRHNPYSKESPRRKEQESLET